MFRPFVACVLLTAFSPAGMGAEQTVLASPGPATPSQVHFQAFPPGTLIGVAILYLDVPDGASVEIGGKPMASWTWSRYRHYWIHGLSLEERVPVKIKVTMVRDLSECKQAILECTKHVHIMNGDRQNLRFHPSDFTVWCAVQGEQCNGCTPKAEPESDAEENGEQEPQETEDGKPSQTPEPEADEDPHFGFSTVGKQPVLCTISTKVCQPNHPPAISSISFQPSTIHLSAKKPLRFDDGKGRQATLISTLQVFEPRGDDPKASKAYPFSPIQLGSVVLTLDEVQGACLQLTPNASSSNQPATLDDRLREAIRTYIDESLFDAISPDDRRVRLIAVLQGKIRIDNREFPIKDVLQFRIRLERD